MAKYQTLLVSTRIDGLELRLRRQRARHVKFDDGARFRAVRNHPFSADAPQQTRSYPRNSSGSQARAPPTSPRPVRHGPRPPKLPRGPPETPCAPRATRSAAEDSAAPRPRITATPSETRASSAAPAPPRRNMLCYPHAAAGPTTPRRPRPPPRLPPRRRATLTAWAPAPARPAA